MSQKSTACTLGLDFGTNSVRALIVDVTNGQELSTAVANYPSGRAGILLDPKQPELARQNPADYIEAMVKVTRKVLSLARKANQSFRAEQIIGLGVDTTGSTPLPVDKNGLPLAFQAEFKKNLNAQAWLWKDHTAFAEAQEITDLAAREHPEYLAKCGGVYSSEWFFSKILHCRG